MTNKEMLSEKYTRLRRRAEERIKKWSNFVSQEHDDLLRVIHELKIHLAEQEIRNEELMQKMVTYREKDELRYEVAKKHDLAAKLEKDQLPFSQKKCSTMQ